MVCLPLPITLNLQVLPNLTEEWWLQRYWSRIIFLEVGNSTERGKTHYWPSWGNDAIRIQQFSVLFGLLIANQHRSTGCNMQLWASLQRVLTVCPVSSSGTLRGEREVLWGRERSGSHNRMMWGCNGMKMLGLGKQINRN